MALNARVERGGVCGFFEQQLFGFRLTWFLSITGWYTCIRSFLSSFFHLRNDKVIFDHFSSFFDQILVIFHGWIFSPERLTHFRDFEGTENVSIFPGRLYIHITSWTTGNLISGFCDLNLVKPGGFFIDFGMAIVSLRDLGRLSVIEIFLFS